MSIIGSNILAGAAGSGVSAYEIEQSLRFDGGASLSRSGTIKGASTFSVWIKRGKLNDTLGVLGLREGSTSNYKQLFFEGSSYDSLGFDNSSGGNAYSNNKFRDPSAWFHVVVVSNTTGTGSKMYINGEEVSYRLQDTTTSSDTTGTIYIGALNGGGSQFNGYLAELHIVDSALEPTDFAEEDENGVWRPIEFTGSYGSNGVYLTFDPTATNGIGHDHSGNGNNFSPTGFTTSGTGTDVMSDTPTTNWCTLNPLEKPAFGTLGNGNLELTASSNLLYRLATIQIPSSSTNKFYWEVKYEGGPNYGIGIKRHLPGGTEYGDTIRLQETNSNNAVINGENLFSSFTTDTAPSSTTTAGDVIGVAYDPSAGTIKWTKNGSIFGEASGLTSADVVPFVGRASSTGPQTSKFIINFGQRDFEYTPPSGGYVALNTSNLPEPEIADGSEYFNTVLWTGNATARDINTGHNSNFTWIKHRSATENHNLYDILRGVGNRLESNSQDYEVNYTDRLTAFNSDGFSLGTGYNNTNSTTYVGWSWAGGGSGTSNSDGSINSTVSASPSSGFSIVTWTGSQADGTVGHGLGVAPSLIIFKRYNNNGTSWPVYHSAIGPSNFVALNETSGSSSSGTLFGSTPTAPTSTLFSVGNNGGTNYGDMVAYCFAEVEGYSKFGTYSSNNSSDGPFVYLGFRPAFILIKDTGSNNWVLQDSERVTYNPVNKFVSPDNANGDASDAVVDFLSNGFKIRTNWSGINYTSGNTYTYAAFAENPFGGDGVSPATAR